MSKESSRKIPKPLKVAGVLTLAAGLSGGIVAAEQGSGNKTQSTVSLSDQLRHPLSPRYTEASPNGQEVTSGQQPPVAETVSEVPGHKDEVEVQFGQQPTAIFLQVK